MQKRQTTETKSKFVFARGCEEKRTEVTANGYKCSFWDDENVLEMFYN